MSDLQDHNYSDPAAEPGECAGAGHRPAEGAEGAESPARASRLRAMELCADRTLEGLDDQEVCELDQLLCAHPDLDDEGSDLAAAALLLGAPGLSTEARQLPPALRARCVESGQRWVAAHAPRRRATGRPVAVAPAPQRRRATPAGPAGPAGLAGPGSRRRDRLGWIAAAGALTVAALAWWPRLWLVETPRGVALGPSPAARRAALIEQAPDLVRWHWTALPHERCAQSTSGDVVWSSDRQEGYLLIDGLQPNDPRRLQYQLWIFDKTRDDRYPVDGGVFDVPQECDQLVVPIRSPIDVREPFQFAVTVEPPGGVVVSDRDVVLLAKP